MWVYHQYPGEANRSRMVEQQNGHHVNNMNNHHGNNINNHHGNNNGYGPSCAHSSYRTTSASASPPSCVYAEQISRKGTGHLIGQNLISSIIINSFTCYYKRGIISPYYTTRFLNFALAVYPNPNATQMINRYCRLFFHFT